MVNGKNDLRVTIKDVAKKAGTSIATVSFVLSDKERYLRPELKEKVVQAAKELGYIKNAAASSLKGKHRGILAILVPQFGNTFFTRMCVEFEAVARQEGYVVMICNSDENPAQEALALERLVSQQIDGCILSPARGQGDNAVLLYQHKIPFLIFERPLGSFFSTYDFVGHDNFQAGFLATQKLLDAGHRRIAAIGWDSPIPNMHERMEGYRAALREYGVSPDREMVLLDGEQSEAAGQRMAAKLPLAEVTAVVATQHEIAKGMVQYFKQAGVRWPADISTVMIGTPEWNGILSPTLTCVERPEEEMGRVAATLLLDNIRNPGQDPVRRILRSTILEGESVREIRDRQ